MILYIFVAVLTVFLGLMVNNHCKIQQNIVSRQQILNRLCLVSVFLLLFGLAACRLNVGNDYAKYVEFMHLINCDAFVPTEAGFNWIVRIIYNLALAIAVAVIPYVLGRQWFKFILLVLLGATLHKSILVVIPLYFLASLTWKKWQLGLAAVFCSTFFFMQDFYLKVVVFLYPTYEDTEYLEGGTSIVNIARCLAVLIFSLIYYKNTVKDKRRNRFYFYCNLGALVMYVCCSFLPIISRIGYYLTFTHIFFLPALMKGVENKNLKKLFTVGVKEE